MSIVLKGFEDIIVESRQGGGEGNNYKKYIPGPSVQEVTLEMSYTVAKTGTPGYILTHTNEAGEVYEERQYISANNFDDVRKNLGKLAGNIGILDALKATSKSSYKDLEDWVNSAATAFNGAPCVCAYKGEEKVLDNEKTVVNAKFWFANAAGSLESVKSYFDKNPDKHLVKLATQPTENSFVAPTTAFDVNKVDPFAANPFVASGTPPALSGDGMVRDANGNILF